MGAASPAGGRAKENHWLFPEQGLNDELVIHRSCWLLKGSFIFASISNCMMTRSKRGIKGNFIFDQENFFQYSPRTAARCLSRRPALAGGIESQSNSQS